MRRLMILALALLAGAGVVHAQAAIPAATGTPLRTLNGVGAAGPGTSYALQPSVYSYSFTVIPVGSVSACTVNLEGSLDGTAWFTLATVSTTDANWANGELVHVVNKPVNFIRGNLTSIAGGGSITATIALFK